MYLSFYFRHSRTKLLHFLLKYRFFFISRTTDYVASSDFGYRVPMVFIVFYVSCSSLSVKFIYCYLILPFSWYFSGSGKQCWCSCEPIIAILFSHLLSPALSIIWELHCFYHWIRVIFLASLHPFHWSSNLIARFITFVLVIVLSSIPLYWSEVLFY